MFLETFISEALAEPRSAVAYQVSRRLASLFPDRAMIEGSDCDFDLADYARDGHCVLRREPSVHGQVATTWNDDRRVLQDRPQQVWYEVDWQGHLLDVLLLTLEECYVPNHWILAESESIARAFFEAVCAHDTEILDEIMVFENGCWQGRAGLFQAIRQTGFDELVLAGSLRDEIRTDVERFFAAQSTYEALGAPWRRGILLTGPPGNGKTHTLKALVNNLGKPCLYVKNLQSDHWNEATCLRKVFEKARRLSPCVLVLEDLDSMVTDKTRSAFLNELDGFASNDGILTLASTNYPERLDPAIVNRPSRFDRTYHFDLPGNAERLAYLAQWNDTLPETVRLDERDRNLVVARTEGFSFAYLKELFLSSILVRAHQEPAFGSAATPSLSMATILQDQAEVLASQMRAQAEAERVKAGEPEPQD